MNIKIEDLVKFSSKEVAKKEEAYERDVALGRISREQALKEIRMSQEINKILKTILNRQANQKRLF